MRLRRDILLFGAVAVAAVTVGWWLLANRPGAAIEAFKQEQRQLAESKRARLPPADAFRATVCASSTCVAVEVGGLTFVFGAGSGAAEGVARLGLMHPTIDALLLPDLRLETVEGLPAIARASAHAGRAGPLTVFGPSGVVPVADGANLMVAGTERARLKVAIEGEDQGQAGRLLFDSGVVTIRGFGAAERGASRVYRVDFNDRSLILAGCLAQAAEIVNAARDAASPALVSFAGSRKLMAGETQCVDLDDLVQAVRQMQIPLAVVVPADRPLDGVIAVAAWRDLVLSASLPALQLGGMGATVDLVSETPRFAQDPVR